MKTKRIQSNILKITLALVFALTIMFSSIPIASAALITESNDPTVNADVSITKELVVEDNVTVPTAGYTFNFTGTLTAVRDGSAGDSQYVPVASIASSVTILPATPKNASGNYELATSPILATYASKYPHAGEYTYTVAETLGTNAGVTYSQASYTMKVYVKNDVAATNGLYIAAITIDKTQDDEGAAATGKVDPATGGFKFVNTYNTTSLKVTNTIVGTYANLSKEFGYTLVFATVASSPSYTATVYKSDGTQKSTFTAVADGSNNTFALANGEYVVINNVVAGTTYTVTQDGGSDKLNYAPKVLVTENGTTGSEQIGIAGSVLSTDTKNIGGTGTNQADFTNTYTNPSITGLIVQNWPFLLLIIIGVAGIVLFLVFKRKRSAQQ